MATGTSQKKQDKLHIQVKLFSTNITEWQVKDDLASMEFPLFSLSKKPDIKIREYINSKSKKRIRVTPSVLGAATVFDKDLLLYIGSQIIENRKLGLTISRTVKVNTYDFLIRTQRNPSGNAYQSIIDILRRLKGTNIETNIITGKIEQTKGFNLIENYQIIRHGKNKKSALEVIITISEWLYNALLHYEVLTIDKRYFQLRQSLERRLYELARKHSGNKIIWKCDLEILRQKSGTIQALRHFRSEVRNIIKRDTLPDYHIALNTRKNPQQVIFYTRNNKTLTEELHRINGRMWFAQLEKK